MGAGFRLDAIYPADEPHSAILSRGNEQVRLTKPGAEPPAERLPVFRPELLVTRADSSPVTGRAGMLYRDLIPGRLGGRYIASHIIVGPEGPVADWVHYHKVALQLIYVRSGSVRVVYEGQGQPFEMSEGDFVLQPPLIRHRVLECSGGAEVVELSAPALHETIADHDLVLPNEPVKNRLFSGQSFLWHRAKDASWTAWNGAEAQESLLRSATAGLVDIRTIRRGGLPVIDVLPHDGELVFGFVLEGRARINKVEIAGGDAFVIPPASRWSISDMTPDFSLLHVTTAALDGAA